MQQREVSYKVGNYLGRENDHNTTTCSTANVADGLPPPPPPPPVDEDCRAKMIQWAFMVVDHVGFQRETVAITTNILDRFLDVTPWALVDRSAFQLAAITCLYTAIKIHEPQSLAISTVASLGRNLYTVEQIEAMEQHVLESNQWSLHPPTAHSFGHLLATWILQQKVEDNDDCCEDLLHHHHLDTLLELVDVQLDAAVSDYELSILVPPSMVAVCAVQNALEGMMVPTTTTTKRQQASQQQQALYGRLCQAANISTAASAKMLHAVKERLHEGLVETCTRQLPLQSSQQPSQHQHEDVQHAKQKLAASSPLSSSSSSLRPDSPKSVVTAASQLA